MYLEDGRAVHGDPFKLRKKRVSISAHLRQLRSRHGNRITSWEEKGAYPPTPKAMSSFQVFLDFCYRANRVGWTFLVDHAKGTLVVGATDSCLNKQAVSLARRTVDRTYIAHAALHRKILVSQKLAYYAS